IPATPPPSKGKDSPVMELTVAVSAPVVEVAALLELPIPGDTPIIGLDMMDDAWPSEAPAHVAPIKGEAPNVVGLTPGVASSVAPMGMPVCQLGHLECQAVRSCRAPGAARRSCELVRGQRRSQTAPLLPLSQSVSSRCFSFWCSKASSASSTHRSFLSQRLRNLDAGATRFHPTGPASLGSLPDWARLSKRQKRVRVLGATSASASRG